MRVSTLSDEATPAKWREMPSSCHDGSPSRAVSVTLPLASSLQTALSSTLLFRR